MKTRKGLRMWNAVRIKELRKLYNERQEDFCSRLGVALPTLRTWEQGLGEPGGSAQILLDRLREDYEEGCIRELV